MRSFRLHNGHIYATQSVALFSSVHFPELVRRRLPVEWKSSSLEELLGTMAGGHHGNGITYGGLTLHPSKGWHARVGKGMCAIMWFWILYRAKQDGAVLMGWRHPWDHAHGHGHAEDHEQAEHH